MKVRISLSGRVLPGHRLPTEIELKSDASLVDALAVLHSHLSPEQSLSPAWLVVVSGEHIGTVGRHPARTLRDGDELLLISPVAGG